MIYLKILYLNFGLIYKVLMIFQGGRLLWEPGTFQLYLSHILGGSGSWSTEGCRMVENASGRYRCQCNHMTHFGVLLQVPAGKAELSEMQRHSLSIVTYVGCGISFVCLLLTFITFAAFR